MDIQRLKALSGYNPKQQKINDLKAEHARVNKLYEQLIRDLEQHRQIDEGLFDGIRAAFSTVGAIGAKGAKVVSDKVKKVGSDVKEIYLDQKAKIELKGLAKNLAKASDDFAKAEASAKTIIDRDKEVAKIMTIFKDAFKTTVDMINARMASARGAVTEGWEDEGDVLDEEQLKGNPQVGHTYDNIQISPKDNTKVTIKVLSEVDGETGTFKVRILKSSDKDRWPTQASDGDAYAVWTPDGITTTNN